MSPGCMSIISPFLSEVNRWVKLIGSCPVDGDSADAVVLVVILPIVPFVSDLGSIEQIQPPTAIDLRHQP